MSAINALIIRSAWRVRFAGRIAPTQRRLSIAAVVLTGCLGACSPIDTWRDVSGVSKNDPDPSNAPFSRNLAEAEASPYPNLASVPQPPTRATTAAERQRLAQSLVADRAAAEAAGRTTGG